MEIKKVTDPSFRKYGKIVEGMDFSGLIKALEEKNEGKFDYSGRDEIVPIRQGI